MTGSNEIKEIEKEAHGIVKIGFDKPKKNKHFFVENDIIAKQDLEAIQTIKKEKKIHYKPFVSEIQEEKVIENTEIDNLDNLKKEIKAKELLLNLMKKEKEISEKIQKKELKIKLKAEKKAKRKAKWSKRIPFRWFKRKAKLPEEIKQEISNPDEIKLVEANDTIFKICPICNSKIKKQKVIQEYGTFRQIFKCKKCPFSKEVVIKL
jgi:hypothetical protein